MLKKILVSLLLSLSGFAWAQPVVIPNEFVGSPEVASVLKEKCIPSCLVLDEKDWAQLKAQIEALIKQRVAAALKGSV